MFHRHRLPVAQFDAIASGSGEYVGELLAGQLSKRLLQIVAMLREIATRRQLGVAAEHFTASFAQLAAFRRRSPESVAAILSYPLVGAWCAHTLRRLLKPADYRHGLDDDLGHLAAIAAAAGMTAGHGFTADLRVRSDGTVMIPTYGLARLDVPAGWYAARAEPDAGTIDVELPGGIHRMPVGSAVDDPHWCPVHRLASTYDDKRIQVLLDDVDPYRDCHRLGVTDRLTRAEVRAWQQILDKGWRTLVSGHTSRSASISAGVSVLVPLDPRGRPDDSSASTSDACGAVTLTLPPDGNVLAEALVHEFQHTKLSALLDLIPLQNDQHAANEYYAPWRTDARHLAGLIHGAYAYLGLVDYWRERCAVADGPAGRTAQFEFARWRNAVRRTLATLAKAGRLTPIGIHFLAGMQRRLAEMRTPAVPALPAFLAREALLDHWLRWRLHNLKPDRDRIMEYVRAWLSGEPAPRLPPRLTTVGTSGGKWAAANDRLALTRLRLQDPDRFLDLAATSSLHATAANAEPADVAYAGGDYQRAAEQFERTLVQVPADPEAWAGLALTQRHLRTPGRGTLLSRPETVRGVYIELARAGNEPHVESLTGWLSRA